VKINEKASDSNSNNVSCIGFHGSTIVICYNLYCIRSLEIYLDSD
jgi:hypothetical protein